MFVTARVVFFFVRGVDVYIIADRRSFFGRHDRKVLCPRASTLYADREPPNDFGAESR